MNIKSIIFREAYAHSRNHTLLRNVLNNLSLTDFKGKTFEEIVLLVNLRLYSVKGIGKLTRYDIIASIAKLFKVSVNHIYIVGNGPRAAIRHLKLTDKLKRETFGRYAFQYIEKEDLIDRMREKGYKTEAERFESIENLDTIESELCVFSRDHK